MSVECARVSVCVCVRVRAHKIEQNNGARSFYE